MRCLPQRAQRAIGEIQVDTMNESATGGTRNAVRSIQQKTINKTSAM
jgi:hypothetical protein